jgi:NADPH:quinone reductase-like Zn-dependent oxidoreductase
VSEDNFKFVRNLGADEVLDYKNEKAEEKLKDYDAVFDTSGGGVREYLYRILKRGGILVSMTSQPDDELAKKYGVTAMRESTKTDRKNLERLTELIDEGIVKPLVDRVFPLEETREAFRYQETGHPRGKVVITIKRTGGDKS